MSQIDTVVLGGNPVLCGGALMGCRILTDFGIFIPSMQTQERLVRVRQTRSGRFDRRFRAARVANRYIAMVERHMRERWLEGANGNATSRLGARALAARIRMRASRLPQYAAR